MSDWLDTAALEFVKQSTRAPTPRTQGMNMRPERSGFGSNMSRMGNPSGIAPTSRPVRNPQTRATPRPPSPATPRIGKPVALPKSMPVPAPGRLVTSSVAGAFFRGVKNFPRAVFHATPMPVKVVGGLGLAGTAAYGVGAKVIPHIQGVQQDRLAATPARRQRQELYNTFRYGAPRTT